MVPLPDRRAAMAGALLLALFVAIAPVRASSESPPLASVQTGSGQPTLVLIHGLGVDHVVWDRIAPILQTRYRLVLVDLPGYGRTPLVGTPSVSAAAAALDRTLKDGKISKPVLVGHSYGALVALEEAMSHPSRVLGVVAIDMMTYTPADSEQLASMNQLMTERYSLFLQGVFGPMSVQPDFADTVIAWADSVPRPVLTAYFQDAWRTDLRPQLQSLKLPILVAVTDHTWPYAESWTNAKKRLGYETAGRVECERIGGTGHLIPIDQPDSLATAIESFTTTLGK